ncbi:MAG: pirin family protein [Sphingomonadales bacterium]|nr:pirin family protein [Sphingomonadales bacterium]
MIEKRPFASLGHADHGWLDARHHFSFASYYDPARMGWGAIRVWNDDTIAPRSGFPPHPHSDMEIITYVRSGAITHRDSMGNEGRTEAGDVQVMSAGTGITHSEANREDEATTLFQIWIMPTRTGEAPGWGQRSFPKGDRSGSFVTLASGMAGDDALPIRTDARVAGASAASGETLTYDTAPERHIYLVVATGRVCIDGIELGPRDGAAIKDVDRLAIEVIEDSEIVLVDSV